MYSGYVDYWQTFYLI